MPGPGSDTCMVGLVPEGLEAGFNAMRQAANGNTETPQRYGKTQVA